jgi:hypothetical protein
MTAYDNYIMISSSFVRRHQPHVAIVLFLCLFFTFHLVKPDFAYGKSGEFRPFGVGYKHKTVVPIWAVSLSLGIFSYLLVLWYLSRL